jgi:hypothetical protein
MLLTCKTGCSGSGNNCYGSKLITECLDIDVDGESSESLYNSGISCPKDLPLIFLSSEVLIHWKLFSSGTGGERVTYFAMSTDGRTCQHDGCGNGDSLGQLVLRTRRPNGRTQELKHSGTGTLYEVPQDQLGGGLICGYQSSSGHRIDNFGLIFLREFTMSFPNPPKASLPPDAAIQTDVFTGRFLCPTSKFKSSPTAQQLTSVCTDSISYQVGVMDSWNINNS